MIHVIGAHDIVIVNVMDFGVITSEVAFIVVTWRYEG